MTAATLLASCSTSSANAHSTSPAVQVQLGGTASWAEVLGSPPTYIFPFDNCSQMPPSISQLQDYMYRPLYWIGGPPLGVQPLLNNSLSIAQLPSYSGRSVTINLKNYKWSDGESVTARDILFWMNIFKVEKSDFCGYVPGEIPDNVTNVTVNSNTQITFTLNQAYSAKWFTYNQLAELVPLPLAWDTTSVGGANGSGGCAEASYTSIKVSPSGSPQSLAAKKCVAVFNFLSKAAGYDPAHPTASNNALATYATNPLWQVVDGPWHLKSFDPSGKAVFIPNRAYSGPVKPKLAQFIELPFTTSAAEFNALLAGQVNVGYLPLNDLTAPAPNDTQAGPNNPRLVGKYTLSPLYLWGFNFFPLNEKSTGDGGQAGAIFHQLYFRQALQTLVNQPLYIQSIDKNYASPTYGPVPLIPNNSYVSPYERANPYPYSVSAARQLLSAHGWNVVPGGVSTCINPQKCGTGIASGAQLSFNLEYASGTPALAEQVAAEASSWLQVGIKVSLSSANFNTVISNAVACAGGPACTWEMLDWGGGWTYNPGYMPTGGQFSLPGAVNNEGNYNSAVNNINVARTHTDASPSAFFAYENYLAKEVPFVYQPNVDPSLTEVSNNLVGVLPQNPISTITPEYWYFVHG